MSDEPEIEPTAQLRQGMHLAEAPFAAQVTVRTRPDGQVRVVLHMEHSAGSTMIVMPPEIAVDFFEAGLGSARQALLASNGPTGPKLIVPGTGTVAQIGNRQQRRHPNGRG